MPINHRKKSKGVPKTKILLIRPILSLWGFAGLRGTLWDSAGLAKSCILYYFIITILYCFITILYYFILFYTILYYFITILYYFILFYYYFILFYTILYYLYIYYILYIILNFVTTHRVLT